MAEGKIRMIMPSAFFILTLNLTKLCKYDIIIITNKFIYQAPHLVERREYYGIIY